MPFTRKRGRTDGNHTEVIEAMRNIGAVVYSVASIPNFTDTLVGYRGQLFIIEIKDGTLPPSKRKLTDGEIKCKTDFERVGVTYHVANSVAEALNIISK